MNTIYRDPATGKVTYAECTCKAPPKEDNTPPVIDLTYYPYNATANDTVTFIARASDPSGIARIEIYINGKKVKECFNAASCSFTGGPYSEGSRSYSAKAFDGAGNSGLSERMLDILRQVIIPRPIPTPLPGLLPDLIVPIKGPERVIAGEDIDLEVTVRNIGSAIAPGSLEVEYWKAYYVDLILSSDSNIPVELAVQPVYAGKTREDFVEDMLLEGGRISRTESILPGGHVNYTLSVHIPKNASPGIYCLGAVVDPAKAVEELNENNNTYCHKINILPPETPPVKPPAGVNFWVMPYAVGGTPLYNIKDSGLTDYTDWMSDIEMVDAPFGGRLGFRHGYDGRIPTDGIKYYRWLYKHESETEWHEFNESVGVHYVKEEEGRITFPVYTLGPKSVNGMNLYEFKPQAPEECTGWWIFRTCANTYWPATDWFGDIYSGFLNSEALSDGKYNIKLEIYDKDGIQVMPDGTTFTFIVPTGVDADGTVLTREASSTEIDNGGFIFTLHIDNRKCNATIDAPTIDTRSVADECGFLRYEPTDNTTVHIAFHATHPHNFAMFDFYTVRGTEGVTSTSGEVSAYSAGVYSGDGNGNFKHDFSRGELLGTCPEAAFSENLHVYAKATNGWGHRINRLDAYAVRAFALAPT